MSNTATTTDTAAITTESIAAWKRYAAPLDDDLLLFVIADALRQASLFERRDYKIDGERWRAKAAVFSSLAKKRGIA
jgi:hypothetical protein